MAGNRVSSSNKLTWWGLGAIAFVMTSCGPFGLEATMENGGALLTLIAVLVVPILYVIPQVLMVSELALMMPSNHGYILWVQRGWGTFAGFFNGYNAVIVNTVDLALYPVLASDYVLKLFGRMKWIPEGEEAVKSFDFGNSTYLIAIATRLSLILIGTFVGCLSTANVSNISIIVCVVVCTSFVIFFCWTLPNMNPVEQVTYDAGLNHERFEGPQWGAFTAAALWLYTGWNSLGSLAGDVDTDEADEKASELLHTDHHAGARGGPLSPQTALSQTQLGNVTATEAHHAQRHVDGYYSSAARENADKPIPPEILTSGDIAIDRSGVSVLTPQEDTVAAAPAGPGLNNVFVRGLQMALILGVVMYTLPLLTCLTSKEARDAAWTDGYLVTAIDLAVPGSFWVIIMIGILSQFGLFYSSLVCYARIVWGLGELGWLPGWIAKLGAGGAPVNATIAQSLALVPLMFFDFSYLQRLMFMLAAIAYILTFTAFLRLRYTEKDTHRPYTVPGGLPVAWLITLTKIIVMLSVAITNAMDPILLAIAVGINVLLGAGYYFSPNRKRLSHGVGGVSGTDVASVADSTAPADCGGDKFATRQSVGVEMNSNDLERPFVGGYSAESPRHDVPSDGERLNESRLLSDSK